MPKNQGSFFKKLLTWSKFLTFKKDVFILKSYGDRIWTIISLRSQKMNEFKARRGGCSLRATLTKPQRGNHSFFGFPLSLPRHFFQPRYWQILPRTRSESRNCVLCDTFRGSRRSYRQNLPYPQRVAFIFENCFVARRRRVEFQHASSSRLAIF